MEIGLERTEDEECLQTVQLRQSIVLHDRDMRERERERERERKRQTYGVYNHGGENRRSNRRAICGIILRASEPVVIALEYSVLVHTD